MSSGVTIAALRARIEAALGAADRLLTAGELTAALEPLKCLNSTAAANRGIEIKYFGEGYSKNTGPRSMYGKALAAAVKFASEFNARAASQKPTRSFRFEEVCS